MEAAELNQVSSTSSAALRPGDELGRYLLLCPIARGGMGQVWAARQTGGLGLPTLVAIKIAIPMEAASRDVVEQYLFDEAQVGALIDHPNVCKILELGREGETLFIAMEWLHGVSMSALLKALPEHRLDYHVAAHLVAQACSGLHSAHELTDDDGVNLEVVHRDATPHNLFITAAGELKVMDFGIVKSRNQQHQATQTGELKGKLSYLAPEQVCGRQVDRRADIFALGGVLYLATLGRTAFNSTGEDAGTAILRIAQGQYLLPSQIDPNYPAELELIVQRALALNVADRFQTAEEMYAALHKYLNDSSRPITRDHVAAVVKQHCGPAIERRRADIRRAQKAFDVRGHYPNSGTFPAAEAHAAAAPVTGESTGTPAPMVEPSMASLDSSSLVAVAERVNALPAWSKVAGAVVATGLLLVFSGRTLLPRPDGASATVVSASAARVVQQPSANPGEAGWPRTNPIAVERVKLAVATDTPDSQVSLDDRAPLSAPHEFNLDRDSGKHTLKVWAEGRTPVVQELRLDRDQTLFIRLQQPAERAKPSSRSKQNPTRSTKSNSQAQGNDAVPSQTPPLAGKASPVSENGSIGETVLRRKRQSIDESDPFAKP